MTHILLIQPPIEDFYLTAKRTVPYGLACIAAALKATGYSVEILDALATAKTRQREWPADFAYLHPFYGRPDISPFALFHHYRHFGYSYAHLEEQIRRSRAAVVGISALFTAYSSQALETAAIARRALPRATIVLGGHHPTALPESVMAHSQVDYVLRGEGEIALPALVRALEGKLGFADVPGLVRRRSDGGLQIAKPAWITDLNALPPPAEALIKTRYYRRATGPGKVLVTSRGCPFQCSYCCLSRDAPTPYRRRSLASIGRELEQAVAHDPPGFINFEDENLTLDKDGFLELLKTIDRLLPPGPVELRAMNGLYPPALDRDMVRTMSVSGFKTLNLALASTDSRQLKRFNRSDVRPHLERILKWCQTEGLGAVTYLIAGAPGQKAASTLTDLCYLAGQPTLAGLSVFYPAPGSRDYDLCRRSGLLPRNAALFRSTALPIEHTTPRLEAVTLLRLARILNFMKGMRSRGLRLPRPTRADLRLNPAGLDRSAIGRRLLSWFFHDGHIRGVTPAGEVYSHTIADDLAQGLLNGLPSEISF